MSTIRKCVPPEFLQSLRDKVEIVPLVSSYVPVSRKGRNYWACCPFHHEKTPSFCIYDDEQSFHCYGCGVSGDIFTFIMKMENMDFLDAVEMLANKSGIPMPEYHIDNDIIEKKKKKDRFLSLLKDANEHYKSNLNKSEKALNYLKSRQLTQNEINDFEIGYSLGWSEIVDYLHSKGYTDADMLEIGIVKKNDSGKLYDFFANRLMFPLFNKFGDCVGFSGRDLDGNSPAKYKNSSQSLVFDKSNVIFAFNKVKKMSTQQKIEYVILCEGQIDVISMHKAGFNTAVACLGTALTELHAKEISRLTNKVILCFDGDNAGVNASLKALPILRAQNLEIRVAKLVGGKDPDEIIKVFGREKMQEIINNSLDSVEFQLVELASHYNLDDIANRTKFISGAFEILNIFNTFSQKEVYVPLVSKISKVSPAIIRADLSKNTKYSEVNGDKTHYIDENNSFDALIKSQQFILSSLIHGKDYATIDDDFDLCLKDASLIKLYEFIIDKKKKGEKLNIVSLFDLFDDDELTDEISKIITFDIDSFKDDAPKHYKMCIRNIKLKQLEIEQDVILNSLKEELDNEKRKDYLNRLSDIIKKINITKAEDFNA